MMKEEMVFIPKQIAMTIGQFLSRVQLQGIEAQSFVQCVAILQQAIQPQPLPPGLQEKPNSQPDQSSSGNDQA